VLADYLESQGARVATSALHAIVSYVHTHRKRGY
jgi:hypothetical protein